MASWKSFKKWWTLPRIIGGIAIALGAIHYLPLPSLPIPSLIDLHNDLAPELMSIGVTLILIDWALKRQSREERKAQVIRQFGSKYRDVTEMARIELEHEGWLIDGSLRDVYLWEANLSGGDLTGADLSGATLSYANLSRADLGEANLSGANLSKANLSGANLEGADLRGVNIDEKFLIGDPSLWKSLIVESRNLRWERIIEEEPNE